MDVLETLRQFTCNGYDEFLRQSRSRILGHGRRLHQRVDTTTAGILADNPEFVMDGPGLLDDVDVGSCLAISELLQNINLLKCVLKVLVCHLLVVNLIDLDDLDGNERAGITTLSL